MNSMYTPARALLVATSLAALLVPSAFGEQRLISFVFGPSSQESARQSARAAASAARHWLQTANSSVEIRRAGSDETQRIDADSNSKDLERVFADAALAARDADPPSFLISLDAAAQTEARYANPRIVVAVLNSPPFSSEGERALERLVDVCQSNSVRVLVLDIAEGGKGVPSASLSTLATKTGGALLSQAKALEPNVSTTVAMATEPEAAAPQPAPAATVEPAKSAATLPGAIPKFEIPVHIRFIRTSGTGSMSNSITDHEADFGTIAVGQSAGGYPSAFGSSEVAYEASDAHQPLHGLIAVEAPLKALKFDVDANTGNYQAKARITATVRNSKGEAVWTGTKDVNLRGPANKLEARLQGSLFFLRAVGVVGKGTFTLEATVEDQVAGTKGVMRTPLKTGSNAPGLVASDALVVRPFMGSADKFEADQVLSYEGEALSPVLNPVFRAEQPVNLQIYLRLYPDIRGGLPTMSMEILHEGRVMARMPLAFKSGLASAATDGASSKIGGRAENMAGGQAKEFPYLVDLKGAKFSPGDYLGVISIRQGKQVITRTVPFRVEGKAQVLLASTAGPKGALIPRGDTEDANVVLPEIEPASVDATGPKMASDEQKRLWDEAAKNAMGYLDHLPNFRCLQETHRFTASIKAPDQLKEADFFKDNLMYENGHERYETIEVNGVKAENPSVGMQGILSRYVFGSMLRGLFDPEVAASYHWAGRAMAVGVLCQVFDVEVAKERTNFKLNQGGRREPVGYTGKVFIDEETGMVRRLTIEGNGLPKDYTLQQPSLSLDYGMVRIGAEDYLLPLRSVLQLRHLKTFVRNETVFRGYRKFEAESEIKFQNN